MKSQVCWCCDCCERPELEGGDPIWQEMVDGVWTIPLKKTEALIYERDMQAS